MIVSSHQRTETEKEMCKKKREGLEADVYRDAFYVDLVGT